MNTLYKRDRAGRIRTWRAEREGSRYRFITGILDGAQVQSGWTQEIDDTKAQFRVVVDGCPFELLGPEPRFSPAMTVTGEFSPLQTVIEELPND